jgi:predicted RNase H-like nuclease (RuvC/YqgF family)
MNGDTNSDGINPFKRRRDGPEVHYFNMSNTNEKLKQSCHAIKNQERQIISLTNENYKLKQLVLKLNAERIENIDILDRYSEESSALGELTEVLEGYKDYEIYEYNEDIKNLEKNKKAFEELQAKSKSTNDEIESLFKNFDIK